MMSTHSVLCRSWIPSRRISVISKLPLMTFLPPLTPPVTGRTVLLQHTDVGGFHQRAEDQDSEVDEDLSHVRSLDEKLIEVAVVTRELVEVDPHLVQDGDVEM